jgi:hypothetical protein
MRRIRRSARKKKKKTKTQRKKKKSCPNNNWPSNNISKPLAKMFNVVPTCITATEKTSNLWRERERKKKKK